MPGGTPLWREISRSIERRIGAGELVPGDKLPTEQDLSRQFMVNRHTVRRALADLQDKGVVESSQGRGSYVRLPTKPARLSRRPRFTEGVKRAGGTPRLKILKLETRPSDMKTARALDLRPGDPIIYLERLRFVNERPSALSQHAFSLERFPTFIEMYRERGTITQTLTDNGVPDYTRKRTAISARLPTPQEADLLHLPRHVPLLLQRYLNIDGLGRPLEFGESRANTSVEIEFEDITYGDLADASSRSR
jgi:phosphonates metabolism transcriptional regulator PhnF